jgi:hypothetical protein
VAAVDTRGPGFRCPRILKGAEDSFDQRTRLSQRILANRAFLIGDLREEPIQRLGSDVVIQMNVFAFDKPELGCLARVLVVARATIGLNFAVSDSLVVRRKY